jgi:hypothetical protein
MAFLSVDRKCGSSEVLFSTKPNFNDGFYAKLPAADKNKKTADGRRPIRRFLRRLK